MGRQIRKRRDHADAILGTLAHADDAATADVDAGVAHVTERVEAVLIGARGDDRAVVFRRGIEVVVVVIEAGRLETPRLVLREHAERGAGLEPNRLDAFNHLADVVEIAILGLAPRRPHAEAARARTLGRLRLGDDGIDAHQFLRLDAGVVVHALRTIGAVFRAAAGLDRDQRRHLHLGGIEVQAMNLLRAKDQFGKRKLEQRAHLLARPVVADGPESPTLNRGESHVRTMAMDQRKSKRRAN